MRMDDIDMRLAIELTMDPRATFRDLAKKLGLSVNAVHKRFRSLQDQGIINRLTVHPSPAAMGSSICMLLARFDPLDEECVYERLTSNERVLTIYASSGDYLFVMMIPLPGEDFEDVVESIQDDCRLYDVFFDEIKLPAPEEPLDEKDHCIITALQGDSRRPLQEVSDITGISLKTVKKRVRRMMDESLIWMRLIWSPLMTGDFFCVVTANLKELDNATETLHRVHKDFMPSVIGIGSFSKRPEFVFINIWAKNMVEIHDIRRRLQSTGHFVEMRYQILTDMRECDCWLDKVSREKCSRSSYDALDGTE